MKRTEKWAHLYEKTHGLTQPNAIANLVAENDLKNIENAIIEVINIFLDKGQLHLGIKVYVDQVLRNDFVEVMAAHRPQKEDTLQKWGDRIFGAQKFGVVFNSLETYNNTIAELMCAIVHPLLKKAGVPLGGLSFLFFMGNYGFTPFGIHKDAKGEEGFLFHIGPGKKEFYTWDTDALNTIPHNTKVFRNVKEMLPTSKKYTLLPSSVMFIPHHVYHIGNTDEFSLSVVMDYINPSKPYLEKELAKEISLQEVVVRRDDSYLSPIPTDTFSESLEEYIDSASITDTFKKALHKKIMKLKSNGGVLKPSIVNINNRLPNGAFAIQGKAVFPIYVIRSHEKNVLIIARGNEIPFRSHQHLEVVLSKLNDGELLTFKNLQTYFLPDWELVDVFSFVTELLKIEAINIIETPTTT